ncbi:hypothetical protein EI613_32950 (plasmid) [Azospirillum sp. 412522]|nr:hypothetical protein [Azospirillum sp. 412522]MBY6266654.1 hypothetical protein [Azospirillum sp. 412522]
MLRSLLIVGALIFTLWVTVPAAAGDAVSGWQGTRWGMSADDVLGAVPGSKRLVKPEKDGYGNSLLLMLDSYTVAQHDFLMKFWFDKGGGLYSLGMLDKSSDGRGCLEAYYNFTDMLMSRYGAPASSKEERNTVSSSFSRLWVLGPTRIELTCILLPGAKKELKGQFTVTYSGIDTAEASKL